MKGRTARAILGQIDTLTTGQAHAGIVQVVDTSLQKSLGPVCRQDLNDRKVRALLKLAEGASEAGRFALLEQAHGVPVADADLKQLVVNQIHAEQERLASVRKAEADEQDIARLAEANRRLEAENVA